MMMTTNNSSSGGAVERRVRSGRKNDASIIGWVMAVVAAADERVWVSTLSFEMIRQV
jgi:hypothetical protein